MRRTPALAVPLLTLLVAGCHPADDPDVGTSPPGGKADDPGSFEDFLAEVYCEPDTEVCIVEGDLPLVGEEALRAYFLARTSGGAGALTVFREDGVDRLWNPIDRFELSYCVSAQGFTDEEHRTIVETMEAATRDWEEVAHVDYRHVPEEDGRCEIGNPRVRFPVLLAPPGAPYVARAFFPYYGEIETAIRISLPELDGLRASQPEATLRGILRHELGHTLGFRHEHIRPENTNWFCGEDENFRPITVYDARSTMHYPFCDGEGDWSLELTELDAIGAAFFYPNWDRYRGGRCQGAELADDGTVDPTCEPVVHEILELANTGSFEILDDWVGLDRRAAEEIVAVRGAQPFLTLEALEDVPFLGPVALRRMYDYLYVDGRCPSETDKDGLVDARCRPVVHRILALANQAPQTVLDHEVGLDSRAAANIVAARAERPFTSLVELWAIPFVKTRAMLRMYEHLHGATTTSNDSH